MHGLSPRREFARCGCSQQCAQVGGALFSERGVKSRLRLRPALERLLQTLLARFGQAELLGPAVRCRRFDRDQAVPLQRRILRPSVVRSITMSSASALIVNGPFRLSLVRIEYWVVRRPL